MINGLVLDRIAPVVTLSSPAANASAQSSMTVTGTCEAGLDINYAGSGLLSSFSQPCTGGSFSQTLYFSAGEGAKAVTVSQTDAAGNTTSVSRNFVRDNTAPTLTQTVSATTTYSKQNTVTFGGACENDLPISVTGADTSSVSCSSGTWAYTTAAKTTDGTYNYTFTQTDVAGNAAAISAQFVRDTVAPTLAVTSANPIVNALDSATWSGTCESGLSISITGSTTATTPCTGGSWSYTDSSTTNGTRNLSLVQTDQPGNVSGALSLSWTRDTTAPNLSLNAGQNSTIKNALNAVSWTGVCEAGLNIVVSGAQSTSFSCPSGTFTYTPPTETADGTRTYNLSQTSVSSVTTTISLSWTRDTLGPVFQASHFVVNSGVGTTSSRQVPVTFRAVDAMTQIAHLCIKSATGAVPSAPANNDSCWVAVNAPVPGLALSPTLNLSNYMQALDFIDGAYTIYAWARDEVGNVSTLTNSGSGTIGQDKGTVTLTQGAPPTLASIFASRANNTYPPLLESDEFTAAGSSVYIKWQASDDMALPANAIRLYFSTDDTNWTEIATGGGVANAVNGSCTVTAPYTGCYVWTSPANAFYRVRALVTDSTGKQALAQGNAMNTSPTRIIAGNPNVGVGGDGKNAVFLNTPSGDMAYGFMYGFVVTRGGDIYVRDHYKGILKISAATGLVSPFLKQTGTASGDGGPVSSAAAAYVSRMILDPQDRLWIWDRNRIRRIDLQLPSPTIQTVIGGGGDSSDTIANPLTMSIYDLPAWMSFADANLTSLFTFSPNGNLYFGSDTDYGWRAPYGSQKRKIRIYRADLASPRIETINLGGVGFSGNTTQNLSACGSGHRGLGFSSTGNLEMIYSEASRRNDIGAATSGDCYGTNHFYPVRFNPTTGQAEPPHPPDIANPSGWNIPMYIPYTGRNGKLYFAAKGPNRIYRYDYDPSFATSGSFTLLAGNGTSGFCADGTLATSCSMRIDSIFVDEQSHLYIMDSGRIRLVKDDGTILTVAGININEGGTVEARSARYAGLLGIDLDTTANPAKVIATDGVFNRMFEITPGGNSKNIAGNGLGAWADTSVAASTGPFMAKDWWLSPHIFVNPSNGLIYGLRWIGIVGALNRTTDRWTDVMGGGATSIDSISPGTPGASINFWTYSSPKSPWQAVNPMGFGNNTLLVSSVGYDYNVGTPWNSVITASDVVDNFKTSVFAGLTESQSWNSNDANYVLKFCPDGTLTSACRVPANSINNTGYARSFYDSTTSTWLVGYYGKDRIYRMGVGQNVVSYALPAPILNFAYRRFGGSEIIYYCSLNDKRIYKQVIGGAHSAIAWSLPSLNCAGAGMVIDETRGVLIFIYESNGLMGIAETSSF